MNAHLRLLGNMILQNQREIAADVHEHRLTEEPVAPDKKQKFKEIESEILYIRENFISLFGEALLDCGDSDKAEQKIREWGEKNGKYFFNLSIPLNEALKDASFYRKYIWKAIQKEAEKNDMPASTIFETIQVVAPLLDKAVYYFSLNYVDALQASLEKARSAFLELSVPVVPLEPDVGILPLIGDIDEERAYLLMEETLKQAEKLRLRYLVMDVSGVHTVDTHAADQLFNVVKTLALIGVKTVITGIRPELASTMVSLGHNFENLTMLGSLHKALNEIRSMKSSFV